MVTYIKESEKTTTVQTRQLPHMHDLTRAILIDALDHARSILPAQLRDIDVHTLLQRPDSLYRFKRQIARGVAEVIAANDSHVQTIYFFEESMNPDSETEDYLPVDLTTHMLVKVQSTTAALRSLITSLDHALTRHMKDLPGALPATRTSILEVIPVTDADIRSNRGYAALLSSVYAPPIRVWAKEA